MLKTLACRGLRVGHSKCAWQCQVGDTLTDLLMSLPKLTLLGITNEQRHSPLTSVSSVFSSVTVPSVSIQQCQRIFKPFSFTPGPQQCPEVAKSIK